MTALNQLAYDKFIDEMGAGKWANQQHVTELELAKRYGMSRTPIRSALQQLEHEGLLKRYGHSLVVHNLKLDMLQVKQFLFIRYHYYLIFLRYFDHILFEQQQFEVDEFLEAVAEKRSTYFPIQKLLEIDALFFSMMRSPISQNDLLGTLKKYQYAEKNTETVAVFDQELESLRCLVDFLKQGDIDSANGLFSKLLTVHENQIVVR
ncbi:GntR family transcriptional regulator [Listeria aquatica]|uniref:GntR family transcriptional regulator n=1 Tax=Listeria aquatica TaxID=1494960 RepID=A0A841ZL90_9LIST|nr:GntR family transcriptional regulator [Listeria aquatica]MBC1520277.1 GntR family transcriptional regulator [Listeria aquatica]